MYVDAVWYSFPSNPRKDMMNYIEFKCAAYLYDFVYAVAFFRNSLDASQNKEMGQFIGTDNATIEYPTHSPPPQTTERIRLETYARNLSVHPDSQCHN